MLEVYGNLGDPEEFVTTNLFKLGLRTLDSLKAALFAHVSKEPNLGNL